MGTGIWSKYRARDYNIPVPEDGPALHKYNQIPADKEYSKERPCDVYAEPSGTSENESTTKSAEKSMADSSPEQLLDHPAHDEYATFPFALANANHHGEETEDAKCNITGDEKEKPQMYPYIDPSSMFPDKYADMPGPVELPVPSIPSAVKTIQSLIMDVSPGKSEESTPRHSPTAAGEMEEDDNTGVDVGSHKDKTMDDIYSHDPLEHSPTNPTPHRLVRKNRISHHKMQYPHTLQKIED